MNEKFKQRLLGLIVVLVLLFALTWLLPRQSGDGAGSVPSTVVPLASVPSGGASGGAADDLGDGESAARLPPDERSPPGEPAQTAMDTPPTDQARPSGDSAAAAAANPSAAGPKPKPGPAPAQKPPPAKADKPAIAAAQPDKPPKSDAAAKTAAAAAGTPPAAAPSPPVAAVVAKAAAAAPDAKIWYVQIASFADQGNAQTTLSLLQNIGYRGEAAPATGANGGTLYRVRLGPFPNEALARAAQEKVAHQGYPQSRAVMETSHGR